MYFVLLPARTHTLANLALDGFVLDAANLVPLSIVDGAIDSAGYCRCDLYRLPLGGDSFIDSLFVLQKDLVRLDSLYQRRLLVAASRG